MNWIKAEPPPKLVEDFTLRITKTMPPNLDLSKSLYLATKSDC